ncbi:hypothetical protein ScPMuIL_006365 [Solemya velum]
MATATAQTPPIHTLTQTVAVEPTLQMKLQLPHPPSRGRSTGKSRNRLKLDPSRALEPARKKISTIEAQRVMSVFEDTIQRIEIVTLLPFAVDNVSRFNIVFGSELVGMLEQHKVIQKSYEDIKSQLDKQLKRDQLKSSSSRSKGEGLELNDDQDDLQSDGRSHMSSAASGRSHFSIDSQIERTVQNLNLVAQQLSQSCKNILRSFVTNPAAINAMKAEFSNRMQECQSFVDYMNELKDILLNKLLTTPEEEKERMEYLHEISKRERSHAAIIEKLEHELQIAVADKEEDIKKKNDVIRRLQADLHQIEKFSEEHIRRVKAEGEKQEAADVKNSEGKKQKLHQEMAQLKTQLQNHVMEHRENEQELRRRKFKIETEVENWIMKFDQDMGERQNEYEEIDAVYTEEKKQLNELEERFKTLESEYQQIMEERRVARDRREAAERDLALMVKAATTIQAFWRSFKVRKALKARKKKGGGKKK